MFDVTLEDIDQIIRTIVISKEPLRFSHIPAKEKKKYIMACMMLFEFEENRSYRESEVNDRLKPIVLDHVMFRRYLIDYRLMTRDDNGTNYRLSVPLSEYEMYHIKKD